MDNYRTFAIFGLLIVSLLLWEAWQNDYVRPQQAIAQAEQVQQTQAAQTEQQDLPSMPTASLSSLPTIESVDANSANTVKVKTDVLDIELSTQGGDIRKLDLLKYAVASDTPDIPVEFLSDKQGQFFVTQSGLRSTQSAPTHYEQYQVAQDAFVLADGDDTLTVPMVWQSAEGVQVTKTYHFKRDSYVVTVEYEVVNNSGAVFTAYPYAQFNRTRGGDDGSSFIYTYTGAVFSSKGNEYEKIDFDSLDDKDFSRAASDGWAAMIQHYFVAAIVPDSKEQEVVYYGKSIKQRNYTAGVKMPLVNVASGESGKAAYRMYIGPKEHQRLEQVSDKLDLTVDYGMLTIISQPLFIVMEWIHSITNNWGWSIVFLTVLIKLVFYRLSAASYRSMAGMRKLTPKLTTLKERYGDDKQRFNQEMMKLYRTEKINPLGGCLPILVQMPVFLAFYWVLVESVELRQADFIFWLNDLTAMDPYFILPVLFGVTMWFQQRLNPAPQDPAQAMVMKAFPIIFTVFFAFFPSGLVLYWLVNNILSIAQQWHITRKLGAL
jgi:YidC/Oxa1 family membrane protein insertase